MNVHLSNEEHSNALGGSVVEVLPWNFMSPNCLAAVLTRIHKQIHKNKVKPHSPSFGPFPSGVSGGENDC